MRGPSASSSIANSESLDFLLDEPCDPDQDHRPQDRHHDAPDHAPGTEAEQPNDPATHHAPDDAEQDIGNHAISAALHDSACSPASDQTNDDPPDDPMCHVVLLEISGLCCFQK